jgi:hypothetical protein
MTDRTFAAWIALLADAHRRMRDHYGEGVHDADATR